MSFRPNWPKSSHPSIYTFNPGAKQITTCFPIKKLEKDSQKTVYFHRSVMYESKDS